MADEPIEREAERAAATGDEAQASVGDVYIVRDEQEERYRGATPPGYDWPTHGGYLGCLLGVMLGCLLAPLGYILFGFIGAFLIQPLGGLGVALAVIATVGLYLAVFVALTRLGWVMGKRFLREYEQPMRPVWGEDDDEEYPIVVEADPSTPTKSAEASTDASTDTATDTSEDTTTEPTPPQAGSPS